MYEAALTARPSGPCSISAALRPSRLRRLVPEGNDRSRGAETALMTPAAGDVRLIGGKGERRPPLPATAISRTVAPPLRSVRPHHPGRLPLPLTPRCSPRGKADGRGHRPKGDFEGRRSWSRTTIGAPLRPRGTWADALRIARHRRRWSKVVMPFSYTLYMSIQV